MEIWCYTLIKNKLKKILENGKNTGKGKEICQSEKVGIMRMRVLSLKPGFWSDGFSVVEPGLMFAPTVQQQYNLWQQDHDFEVAVNFTL